MKLDTLLPLICPFTPCACGKNPLYMTEGQCDTHVTMIVFPRYSFIVQFKWKEEKQWALTNDNKSVLHSTGKKRKKKKVEQVGWWQKNKAIIRYKLLTITTLPRLVWEFCVAGVCWLVWLGLCCTEPPCEDVASWMRFPERFRTSKTQKMISVCFMLVKYISQNICNNLQWQRNGEERQYPVWQPHIIQRFKMPRDENYQRTDEKFMQKKKKKTLDYFINQDGQ